MPNEPRDRSAEAALRNLEQRLTRASAAAERLIVEAADAVAGGGRGVPRRPASDGSAQKGERPASDAGAGAARGQEAEEPAASEPAPAGYQGEGADRDRLSEDLELLAGLARRFRDLVPPELEYRLAEALRELLLAVRALVDWYLDRLERRRRTPPEVRDIPIL